MRKSKVIQLLVVMSACWFNSTGANAQSPFPVMLSSPMDNDTIIETQPNLMWQTDLNGLIANIRFSQRLVLCELETDQWKGDAITLNTPLLVLDDYQSLSYNYNGTTAPLEMGHTYVWQVQIRNSGLQVDQSEVYQFTIFEPSDTLPRFYPVVIKNDRQIYQVRNGKIGLITEDLGTLDLAIRIEKSGTNIPNVFLNELVNGEMLTDTTSTEYNGKRTFVLNVEELNLEQGQYTAIWKPVAGKCYVFNFEIN
jgi:hypothetical protein